MSNNTLFQNASEQEDLGKKLYTRTISITPREGDPSKVDATVRNDQDKIVKGGALNSMVEMKRIYKREGINLIHAKSTSAMMGNPGADQRPTLLNPLQHLIFPDDNSSIGFTIRNIEDPSGTSYCPVLDDYKTPISGDDVKKQWPEMVGLNWEAGGRPIGGCRLSDVVAVRLFESMEDKWHPTSSVGDTVFMFPNYNGDGTLVSEHDAKDVSFGLRASVEFDTVKQVFEDAGINLIQMIDQHGNEIFVNEEFELTVRNQLANIGTGPDLGQPI